MQIEKQYTYETTSIYRIDLTEEKLRSLFNKVLEELKEDGFERFKKNYFSDERLIKRFLLNDNHAGIIESSIFDELENMFLDGWWDDHCNEDGKKDETTIEIDGDL